LGSQLEKVGFSIILKQKGPRGQTNTLLNQTNMAPVDWCHDISPDKELMESVMHVIECDKTYELGIQIIDDHHRKLIELLNNSYDLLLFSTDKAEIKTILQELADYADYHFNAEEHLMNEVSYKGLMPHVDKHNSFKNQLAVLMQDYLSRSPNVNTDIILFLSDWLKKHILKDDRKFAIYLSKSKYPSTAATVSPVADKKDSILQNKHSRAPSDTK